MLPDGFLIHAGDAFFAERVPPAAQIRTSRFKLLRLHIEAARPPADAFFQGAFVEIVRFGQDAEHGLFDAGVCQFRVHDAFDFVIIAGNFFVRANFRRGRKAPDGIFRRVEEQAQIGDDGIAHDDDKRLRAGGLFAQDGAVLCGDVGKVDVQALHGVACVAGNRVRTAAARHYAPVSALARARGGRDFSFSP